MSEWRTFCEDAIKYALSPTSGCERGSCVPNYCSCSVARLARFALLMAENVEISHVPIEDAGKGVDALLLNSLWEQSDLWQESK